MLKLDEDRFLRRTVEIYLAGRIHAMDRRSFGAAKEFDYNRHMDDRWKESKETYSKQLKSWLDTGYIGKYIAIKGSESIGPFNSQEQASKAGFEKFGEDFLLSDIVPEPRLTNIAIKAG